MMTVDQFLFLRLHLEHGFLECQQFLRQLFFLAECTQPILQFKAGWDLTALSAKSGHTVSLKDTVTGRC